MKGNITSIDPMSFDAGPGIRTVIKLDDDAVVTLTPNETVDRIRKFRPYIGPDDGGVTFMGTSLFKQSDYLKETTKISHKAGFTTCIITNGIGVPLDSDLFKHIDFVILEIDSIPLYNYNNLSTDDLLNVNKFVNMLEEAKITISAKQVIKKGLNDSHEYIHALKKYLGMYESIKNIELTSEELSDGELNELKELLKEA